MQGVSAAARTELGGMLMACLCGTLGRSNSRGDAKGAATPTCCCTLLCGEALWGRVSPDRQS